MNDWIRRLKGLDSAAITKSQGHDCQGELLACGQVAALIGKRLQARDEREVVGAERGAGGAHRITRSAL